MKFRKKPVVIDAFQMTEARRMDNSDWPNWLNSAWNKGRDQVGSLQRADMTAVLPDTLEIVTLEGNHKVSWGDYIIRGVQGELYPCKPEIFVATYEPVGAIDPAEVLAKVGPRCAECDCDDGNCTWIASGPADECDEGILPCPFCGGLAEIVEIDEG